MIYAWIFIIVFPVVLLLQLNAQRKQAKKRNERFSLQHATKALIHTVLLTLVAYIAYFASILFNA